MKYYGIDTEFFQSGKADQPDVHTIQISDGETTWVFRSREELYKWFRKNTPKLLFTWTTEAEFGSFKAWDYENWRRYMIKEKAEILEITPDSKKAEVERHQAMLKDRHAKLGEKVLQQH